MVLPDYRTGVQLPAELQSMSVPIANPRITTYNFAHNDMPKVKRNKIISKVYQKCYTQDDIYKAMEAIDRGASLRSAAKLYNVPTSTLNSKRKNLVPLEVAKGPGTVLTTCEETRIVDWIVYSSERGHPVTKCLLLDCVQVLVDESEKETPFKNNRPGRHWFEGFFRRHPELTLRVAQNLTLSRISANEEKLRMWFTEIQNHLELYHLLQIHPSRIFNCDETAMMLCPKADMVIAKRGSKSVYKVINGDEKESLTTLFMVNAEGTFAPPLVLFWYQRIPFIVASNMPKDWAAGTTEKGWMTAKSFYEYVTNIFYPWLKRNNIAFPVVLYVDGHASHLTLPLCTFCKEYQIELIALYPNATHVLQPLDVAFFHPLKVAWKKAVDDWKFKNNIRLKKENFAPLLKTALDNIENIHSIIQNGFRTCGLSPFSPDAVNFNVLNKDKNKKKNDTQSVQQQNCILTSALHKNDTRDEDFKQHLKLFESNVGVELLKNFKDAESGEIWKVNIENEGLYRYWINVKNLCGA